MIVDTYELEQKIRDMASEKGYTYNRSQNMLIQNTEEPNYIRWDIIYLYDSSYQLVICRKYKNSPEYAMYVINWFESKRYPYKEEITIDNLQDELCLFPVAFEWRTDDYYMYNVRKNIKVGDIVKHFKAEISDKDYVYKIIAISIDCNVKNKYKVTYQELFGDHKSYVRDYDEFMGFVDFNKYPNIKQVYRFEIIGHDSDGGY